MIEKERQDRKGDEKMANVTVTCQYTNIQFQAASKRSKNHPRIAGWLNTAFEEGWRDAALKTIEAGREAGFTEIAEYVEVLKETQTAALAKQAVDYSNFIIRQRERKAEAKARNEAFMTARANGTYQRAEHDDEVDPRDTTPETGYRSYAEREW